MENIVQQKKSKRAIENKEYISYSPDEVMLQIFCLLTFKTLILASVVSKQWESMVRTLLSMIPSSINFDELEMAIGVTDTSMHITSASCICWKFPACLQNSIYTASRNFSQFVDRTLHRHTDYIIKRLRFAFCYDGQPLHKERIDKWVQFAMTHEIKEIELNFSAGRLIGYGIMTESYELPHDHFSPKSLEHITLNFCKLGRCCLGVYGSLQSLYFKDVKVLDILLEDLVSKCPMLEDLILECCNVPYQFMVCPKDIMVKKLSMIGCHTEGWPTCCLHISTPEILMLSLMDCHLPRHRIKNASKLTDLVFEINQQFAREGERETLGLLLQGLSHCQTLSMNSWCIQALVIFSTYILNLFKSTVANENSCSNLKVLSFRAYFSQQSTIPFYNLKHLKLKVGLHIIEFPGIAYMTRNCSILESLTLYIQEPTTIQLVDLGYYLTSLIFIDEDNYWHSQTSSFYCLKEVTIYGFSNKSNEKQMVLFLLRNAKVLRNMSIYLSQKNSDPDNFHELEIFRTRSGGKITSYGKRNE